MNEAKSYLHKYYFNGLTLDNIKNEVSNKPLDTLLERHDEETHDVWKTAVKDYEDFAQYFINSYYLYLNFYFDKCILLVPNKTIARSQLEDYEKHIAFLLKKLCNIDEIKKDWFESDPTLDRTMEKIKKLENESNS